MRSKKRRSGFEELVEEALTKLKPDIKFEYEPESFEFVDTKTYTPDFKITGKRGKEVYYVEAKGWFDAGDRKKMLLVKKQHPDKDIRLLFQSDNWITKAKKSRYSCWAKRHGFSYHVSPEGKLPDEWINEPKINKKGRLKKE